MIEIPENKRFLLIVLVLLLAGMISLVVGLQFYENMRQFYTLEGVVEGVKKEYPEATSLASTALGMRLSAAKDPEHPLMLLVDCREPEEYRVSHLEGAVNLRTPAEILQACDALRGPAEAPSLGPEAPPRSPAQVEVYVYCSVGHRSAKLVQELAKAGSQEGRYLRGGLFFWARESRPMVDSAGNATKKLHPYKAPWKALVDPENRAGE